MAGATRLLPSIKENNPAEIIKENVGNLIYSFVEILAGKNTAPKITGMLIDLPNHEIKQYLQSYDNFRKSVEDAKALLTKSGDEDGPQQK